MPWCPKSYRKVNGEYKKLTCVRFLYDSLRESGAKANPLVPFGEQMAHCLKCGNRRVRRKGKPKYCRRCGPLKPVTPALESKGVEHVRVNQ